VDAEQAGDAHPTFLDVILRDVAPSDDAALASFDPGSGPSWLDEVAEIVGGLIAWGDDPAEHAFDRRVVVAEDAGQIVAVAAHERVEHERAGVLAGHRYLMVVAVRQDRQRSGLARLLAEAVVADAVRRRARQLAHPPGERCVARVQPERLPRRGRVVTSRG
jgi:GNAT superfamily N-acetyltransferase